MTDHAQYRFSITIRTDNFATVGHLRALAEFSQKKKNNNTPSGGTKEKDWRLDRQCVTFRFSTPEYRDGFVSEVQRLLPQPTWKLVGKSDDDPATR